jgi:pyruvate formate lyase activating enzyme
MIKGRIHSIETMGLVDGPGIRAVVFLQGRALRCAYCHNADTWALNGGIIMTPDELVSKILKFKPYFDRSKGGVTFSGGEPLLQKDFLIETLKLCKENRIHTTIDTAGCGKGDYEEILKYVDLILFDIKSTTKEKYKDLTLMDWDESFRFLEIAIKMNKKFWIRHVVVPGINDNDENLKELADIIKNIKNVYKVELLPYHCLGANKFKELGIDYTLKDIKPMDKNKTKELEDMLKKLIHL